MAASFDQNHGRFGWQVEHHGSRAWLRLSGELDLAAADALRLVFDRLYGSGWPHVFLDLRHLTFIDVAGMRVLCEESGRARELGGSASIQACPCYERLLAVAGPGLHGAQNGAAHPQRNRRRRGRSRRFASVSPVPGRGQRSTTGNVHTAG